MRTATWVTMGMLATSMALAACTERVTGNGGGVPPAMPTGLTYQLEPSGTPGTPRGIILRWTDVTDASLGSYNVYSRSSATGSWGLRGTTTSPSFHDDGVPALDYAVSSVSVDGAESGLSDFIEVDERLALAAPNTLTSISLDGAVHLQWADNAYTSAPDAFDDYRVYSTSYNLDANSCGTSWVLEGTTVSPSFLVDALTNGVSRCFAVSAISIEGYESLWSPLRNDTPRPDGHNVIVFTAAGSSTQSGFRFYKDLNSDGVVSRNELGLVGASTDTAMDFTIVPDSTGKLFIQVKRAADSIQVYGSAPIAALTDIDWAPAGGYTRSAIEAKPLWGYVFQFTETPFFRYGSLRVSAVGTNYVIFDWAFQTDWGNPELLRRH